MAATVERRAEGPSAARPAAPMSWSIAPLWGTAPSARPAAWAALAAADWASTAWPGPRRPAAAERVFSGAGRRGGGLHFRHRQRARGQRRQRMGWTRRTPRSEGQCRRGRKRRGHPQPGRGVGPDQLHVPREPGQRRQWRLGGKGGDSFLGAEGRRRRNRGAANGGGVHNLANGSTILVNCTFAANSAEGGQGGEGGIPTGVAVPGGDGLGGPRRGGALASAEGTVTLKTALLAAGASGNGASGTITDGGNNLSSDATPPFSSASSHNNSGAVAGDVRRARRLDLDPRSHVWKSGHRRRQARARPLPTRSAGRRARRVCDIGAYEHKGSAPAITPIPDRTVNED